MSKIKLALIAGVLATGLSAGAQAMPVSNLATIDSGAQPEPTRWVCNAWGRCWWRPNYYYRPYAYYPAARGFTAAAFLWRRLAPLVALIVPERARRPRSGRLVLFGGT